MEQNYQTYRFGAAPVDAARQNRVLRNTYALLALSMVPTIIGALFGTLYLVPFMVTSPFLSLIVFFIGAYGLMFAVQANRNNGLGVILLLVFTLFMGAMLGPLLSLALHFRNGGQLIAMAAGGTGAIFLVLAGIASTTKRDFSGMGKFLMTGMILVLICAVANIFFQIPAFALAISALIIVVFSGFILYDINRIVRGGETSYVSATLSVYISIYNIFTSLLQILMALSGNSRD